MFYSLFQDKELPSVMVTQSESVNSFRQFKRQPSKLSPGDASRVAFEKLRDCAIENLCKGRTGQFSDPQTCYPTLTKSHKIQRNNANERDYLTIFEFSLFTGFYS